eukprot:scaffold62766_cov20-Tisochrysis_lutea.AAC.1
MHGAWKQWGRPVHQCAPSSVEHGITEMVHGCVDIVEMQMRLQIPGLAPEGGVSQILKTLGGIETTGHAIEVVEAAVLTTPVAGLPSFVRPQCNGNDVLVATYDCGDGGLPGSWCKLLFTRLHAHGDTHHAHGYTRPNLMSGGKSWLHYAKLMIMQQLLAFGMQ